MKTFKNIIRVIIALVLTTFVFTMLFMNNYSNHGIKKVSYNEFMTMTKENKVDKVSICFTDNTFEFNDFENIRYETDNPKYDDFKKDLLEMGVEVEVIENKNTTTYISLFINIAFYGVMFYLLFSMMKGQGRNLNNKVIRPEKNEVQDEVVSDKGKKTVKKRKTSFKDVAGLKEVKADMMLLVDFLKNPNKYTEAGAKLPKGVIFYGPPGTGKTLLAKAIAGEADVPFFYTSGSDFIEMFVGLGAKRVRDLFNQARKEAPCIIFIDELDAIGNSRNSNNGNSEHRQTINALLAEIDGFNGSEGVLVIGATNRIEDLDKALIRPGRFDKHICIPLPESPEDRLEIINIYAKNKKFAEDVDFNLLSKQTIGFSPANIESLLNEAALISVQKEKRFIDNECIDDAIFKQIMKGHAKKNEKKKLEDVEFIAWHEAGHAVISKLFDIEVAKVTIIPSTSGAGGVNIIVPKKMGAYSKEELKNRIKSSYGGRAAEYIFFGRNDEKVTTGASQDIINGTEIIKAMIEEDGMSKEFGMLNLNILGADKELIIREANDISKALYDETLTLLEENLDFLKEVVSVLLEKETISGTELDEIYEKYKK